MKARSIATLVALGFATAAWGQAPATAEKPTISKPCMNCHKAAPGELQGSFENVAFKSQSIQMKIDAATEIVRFDPKTIKVTDAGDAKTAEALRDIKKGHEARIAYVEKDGVKTATAIWFKGPIKIAPEKLVMYDQVAALVAKGPEAGNYTLVDSRPLPRVQEGTIPTAINLPFTTKGFDELAAEDAAGRQGEAAHLLLPGHHLHAEPQLAAPRRGDGLHQREGLPRRLARVDAEERRRACSPRTSRMRGSTRTFRMS